MAADNEDSNDALDKRPRHLAPPHLQCDCNTAIVLLLLLLTIILMVVVVVMTVRMWNKGVHIIDISLIAKN